MVRNDKLYGRLHYARWQGGEVDIVGLDQQFKAEWAVEIKWSDRIVNRPEELKNLVKFCQKNNIRSALVTTKSFTGKTKINQTGIQFIPASEFFFNIGEKAVSDHGFYWLSVGYQVLISGIIVIFFYYLSNLLLQRIKAGFMIKGEF